MLFQSHRLVRVGALSLCALPSLVRAQDPVVKPTPTSTAPSRLVAPSTVVARQRSDGRIEVRWARVEGAVAYRLMRSIPNLQPERAITPDPGDTTYVDNDVKAGYSYYYLVSALNDAGQIGLKRGAAPVSATVSAGAATTAGTGSIPPVDSLRATPDERTGGAWLNIRFVPSGRQLLFDRRLVDDPNAPWIARPNSTMNPTVGGGVNSADTFRDVPVGTRLQWRVTVVDPATGARSTPVVSNVVTSIPMATTTAATTTSTTALAAGTAVGNVLVSVAAPFTIKVGTTAALTAALGGSTALRWLSIDETIATVDATGTATGRAAGRAQVLAVGRGSDGAVRVTSVQVSVTP